MVETRAKPGDLKPSGRSRLEGFRICVAQIGARRHYLVPRALHQAGLLDRLYTDSYIGNKPWAVPMVRTIANLTGSYGARRYLGRNAPDLPPEKVLSFDLLGLSYFLQNRRRRLRGTVSDTYSHFGSLFGRSVIAAGFGAANAVYGFNGASVEIFEAAKQKGLRYKS